jgi:hypothetical protein
MVKFHNSISVLTYRKTRPGLASGPSDPPPGKPGYLAAVIVIWPAFHERGVIYQDVNLCEVNIHTFREMQARLKKPATDDSLSRLGSFSTHD